MKHVILLITLFSSFTVLSQSISEDIRINQIGFFPAAEKIAVIVNTASSQFDIRVNGSSQVVYSGTLSTESNWNASGEAVKLANFSEFDALGSFQIFVAGKGVSHPFTIQDDALVSVAKGTLKALYFNRASTALEESYADEYARPLGHPDNEVVVHPSAASPERPAGTVISTPFGWYDAGDYNKYIVNSGISVFSYLAAYENFPAFYDTLSLNIPESDNNIPDILDEALWNIKWMATMQDPNDGGIYNKTTTANFQGVLMPHIANATRYVVAKGTAATLDFAAVMAMAARIYEPYMPDFAADCIAQAKLAWQWASDNPNVAYNNPSAQDGYPAVSTGGYGDGNFADEFLWAAAELYITTLEDSYYTSANFNQNFGIPGWPSVQTLALLSLTTHRNDLTSVADIAADVTPTIIAMADGYVNSTLTHPYHIPESGFWWGSNSGFGNIGVILLYAYELTEEAKYYNAAIHTVDYLLGRNATTFSFVTGFGDKTPMNIHHRQSEADDIVAPVPGFLAGGPNPGNQDQDCGSDLYPSTLPAKSYLDDWCSYSTNEITINWNAPIAFMSGALQYIYLRDFQRESNYEFTPLGINEEQGSNINVYPNPAKNRIFIERPELNSENTKIKLFNITGGLVYEDSGRYTTRIDLDVSSLSRGIYMVQYQNGSVVHSKRVRLN